MSSNMCWALFIPSVCIKTNICVKNFTQTKKAAFQLDCNWLMSCLFLHVLIPNWIDFGLKYPSGFGCWCSLLLLCTFTCSTKQNCRKENKRKKKKKRKFLKKFEIFSYKNQHKFKIFLPFHFSFNQPKPKVALHSILDATIEFMVQFI